MMSTHSLPDEIQQLLMHAHDEDGEIREPALVGLEKTLQSLACKQEHYEDLLNTFFLMANAESKDQLVTLIIKAATRITEAERATYFAYQPETQTLRFSSLAGGGDDLANLEIPAAGGVVGHVVQTKESFVTHDAQNEPLFDPTADSKSGFTTQSILAMPVISRAGELQGVIESINKKEGEFSTEDTNLLALLANNVVIAERLFQAR